MVGAQELAHSSEWVSGMSVNLVPHDQSLGFELQPASGRDGQAQDGGAPGLRGTPVLL